MLTQNNVYFVKSIKFEMMIFFQKNKTGFTNLILIINVFAVIQKNFFVRYLKYVIRLILFRLISTVVRN